MPEYLAPGVYIEETSYRAKSIEGVATSTTGFVGECRTGPSTGPARLVTSFEEFRRTFGGLSDLSSGSSSRTNYMAHAARAYFENGGKRLYIARVLGSSPTQATGSLGSTAWEIENSSDKEGVTYMLKARYAGSGGNLSVSVGGTRSVNLITVNSNSVSLSQTLSDGDIVEVASAALNQRNLARTLPSSSNLRVVRVVAGIPTLVTMDADGVETVLSLASGQNPAPTFPSFLYKLNFVLLVNGEGRSDTVAFSVNPSASDSLAALLDETSPLDRDTRVVWSQTADPDTYNADGDLRNTLALARTLVSRISKGSELKLSGGTDGAVAGTSAYEGEGVGNTATGLKALEEIDDIAIVAAPGGSSQSGSEGAGIRGQLISHCENLRYRFAVLSAEDGLDTNGIREVRAALDSTYAALYYPWITARDPNSSTGATIHLPPDGYMTGIYARSDVERGVHKAPANEVVRGALGFAEPISQGLNEVLNPEGINCLRFFEGRGNRVWGARTISSDPEWTYINVRRLFIYLEHSIDRATQWVVFEPNNETLWKKVTMTVESFLTDVWRTGALMGATPEEAFFVKCDRTTMTQGDLDNGRLVCLIGVAPTKPAEFVIFRIGQWTADSSIL